MTRGTTKKRSALTPGARAMLVSYAHPTLVLQMRGESLERGAGERALHAIGLAVGDEASVALESEYGYGTVTAIAGDRITIQLTRALWFADELARGVVLKRWQTPRRSA